MNKKIIVLLVVTLLLNCLAFPIYATDINIDNISAKRGQEVTAYAKLSEAITVKSGAVSIVYDNASLKLIKTEWHPKEITLQNFDYDKNLGAFAFSESQAIDDTVFSATFLILDNAPLGDTDIEINIKLKNSANEYVLAVNRKGALKIFCNHDFTKKDTSEIFRKSVATCTSPAIYYYSCSICGEKGETTFEYGATIEHTYNQKVTTNEYIKTPATCTKKAEYYYSCVCGKIGSESFETEMLPHDYSTSWISDSNNHWHECTVCGDKNDVSNHAFEQKHDDTNHWLECSVCHEKKDIVAHIFDNSCDTTCDTCGYTRAITHSYEQKHDENSHRDECRVCGDKQNVETHIFDNACDTTCDTCGYTRSITHNYEQKHDDNNHWDECTVCGDRQNITAHIFDNACDTTCDACGYTRTITHNYEQKHDDSSHWNECSVCHDKKDITDHVFDNACDTTCDTCGYVRATTHSYEQKHDEANHWDECSVCHDKKDITSHIFDNACDTTCDACGYTRSITHSYEQKYDELNHWNECSCGFIKDKSEHTLDGEGKCKKCRFGRVMLGDLNYDGKVNAIDLTILRRYLARYSSEIDIAVADFNGDGKVNTLDLMLLRRFLVGYDSVLGK